MAVRHNCHEISFWKKDIVIFKCCEFELIYIFLYRIQLKRPCIIIIRVKFPTYRFKCKCRYADKQIKSKHLVHLV